MQNDAGSIQGIGYYLIVDGVVMTKVAFFENRNSIKIQAIKLQLCRHFIHSLIGVCFSDAGDSKSVNLA